MNLFIQAYQRYLKKDKDENTNGLIDRHKKPDTFVSGFLLLPLLEKVTILMR
jgi:hypothetical protein